MRSLTVEGFNYILFFLYVLCKYVQEQLRLRYVYKGPISTQLCSSTSLGEVALRHVIQ